MGGAVDGFKTLMSSQGGDSAAARAAEEKTEKTKGSRATVWSFSGCKDDQTSADATFANLPSGN